MVVNFFSFSFFVLVPSLVRNIYIAVSSVPSQPASHRCWCSLSRPPSRRVDVEVGEQRGESHRVRSRTRGPHRITCLVRHDSGRQISPNEPNEPSLRARRPSVPTVLTVTPRALVRRTTTCRDHSLATTTATADPDPRPSSVAIAQRPIAAWTGFFASIYLYCCASPTSLALLAHSSPAHHTPQPQERSCLARHRRRMEHGFHRRIAT